MNDVDVVVVGGGLAALSAASLLAHAGRRVRLLEAGPRLGGKAGVVSVQGVELDTGPSVLTLPQVLFDLFDQIGLPSHERFECVRSHLTFRYLFPNGVSVDFFHELEQTLGAVESTFGSQSRKEFETYLASARRIWLAAAPHFVFNRAPSVRQILSGGPKIWAALSHIDATRSLQRSIRAQVKTPELAAILERYATYNGSDARRAPATLGCIAHVELALGAFGVRGGMRQMIRSFERALRHTGVEVRLDEPVEELLFQGSQIVGVRTSESQHFARAVLLGADPWQWRESFPARSKALGAASTSPSMSAHNALFLRRRTSEVAPHTVLFPANYEREFADIFDYKRLPREPTIYACAQDRCHDKQSFRMHEPLFTMVNAPALGPGVEPGEPSSLLSSLRSRLEAHDLLHADAECVWTRSPSDLSREFPGSFGALYGPASNSMASAFQRLPNRFDEHPGLYLASGSAHPGGGVPLAVQSGKMAARLLLEGRV